MSVKESDISVALAAHLSDMFPVPDIVWENDEPDTLPAKPYLIVKNLRTGRADRNLRGGSAISTGVFFITVVAERGGFANAAEAQADALIEHFAPRTRLPITGGQVVLGDGRALDGVDGDVSYRVPVRINYTAHKT